VLNIFSKVRLNAVAAPSNSARGSSYSRFLACLTVLSVALACMAPGAAWAAATPPTADFPSSTPGLTAISCKYQVWTNGPTSGVIPFVATPAPSVTGLGAPAFSGILTSTSVPPVTSFINVPAGNSTWSVPNGGNTVNVCVQWDAYFYASAAGTYTFTTTSDDGSLLFIGSTKVVDNNFSQGVTARSGLVSLDSGFHRITVMYGQGGGGFAMSATSSFNSGTAVDINTNLFVRLINTPTFTPAGGQTGTNPLNVTISVNGAPAGTVIYYTEDGSVPNTSSPVYPGSAIPVSVPKTINAIAVAPGYDGSVTGTVSYTQLPTNPVTFSVPSGPYTGAKTLNISSTTANAFIYYTTDGTTPTFQNYTGVGSSPVSIPLTGNQTISAFAAAFGFSPSAVATAFYTRTDVVTADNVLSRQRNYNSGQRCVQYARDGWNGQQHSQLFDRQWNYRDGSGLGQRHRR
jgi:hypothetical protein